MCKRFIDRSFQFSCNYSIMFRVPQSPDNIYCVFLQNCFSGFSPHEEKEKHSKWGYISHGDNIGKQDKDATGLYHLNTIHLPQQLEKNLENYLQSKTVN